ncbi:phosphoglucomutase [Catalinimonas alkaloidigena]|uniref:phospho-sugar mutase n=1 Tax=Catalinimonas alkaloidigena TaxID=1075417 RepID=UPI002406F202|nr:phospho-sugar mutase [Catalinimonas alkaloidigena]MDF9794842.1 phosphoglucomutase [Catalinimonas alkaloidigena]
MDIKIKEKAQKWLDSNIDDESKLTIKKMLQDSNEEELVDAFYKDLEFGTGGLRGVMGVGSNRINKYTVGMATQGLSNYLLQTYPDKDISVAIAHDSRNNSRYFAQVTADVFSANGIKVYFFDDLRPTPELSFAIRTLNCDSGVVLTASHNPKEYNGYKAYWNDGGQLIAPHDKNVIREVGKIEGINAVKFDKDESKIQVIGKDIDDQYLSMLKGLSLSPEAIERQKDLKIVFTSIHGTAIKLVPPALEKLGFTNVHIVQEQAKPDGNFPTVVYPNPEESEALDIALKQATEIDADILMGTDPDADRVGIAAKNPHGKFQLLNGNQTGSMLIHYLLKMWQEKGKLDGKQFVAKTIVTTDLIEKIAENFDVSCYDTLTGFKYIAALIREKEGQEEFIGGGEESYGYLFGDKVRDKDAVASCVMIAEMAAYVKDQGMSLFDFLLDTYLKFGLYHERLHSLTKKGKSGVEEIQQMMLDLRNDPPKTIGGEKVVKIIDYQEGKEKDMTNGDVKPIDFPESNVLQFFTEGGSKISARPSGTEPKIKFYFSIRGELDNKSDYDKKVEQLEEKISGIIREMQI